MNQFDVTNIYIYISCRNCYFIFELYIYRNLWSMLILNLEMLFVLCLFSFISASLCTNDKSHHLSAMLDFSVVMADWDSILISILIQSRWFHSVQPWSCSYIRIIFSLPFTLGCLAGWRVAIVVEGRHGCVKQRESEWGERMNHWMSL